MSDRKFFKPAAGIVLPLADGRPWPSDGEWVEVDQYVRRRLADSDLVAAKPPAVAAPSDAETKAETRKGK